jgi:uncharacterized protein DUF4019
MIRRAAPIIAILAVICAAEVSTAKPDYQQAVQQATRAADSWLKLVDAGDYTQSYNDASIFFKSRVTEDAWVATVGAVRKPFGDLLSRKLKNAQYATSLPGAPDGEYVVIQYDTSFANKKAAVETVTPMLDKDGKWRVSGYFIK